MKKIKFFITILGVTTLLTGCMPKIDLDQEKEEVNIVLTERQKEILTNEGLPTVYDELSIVEASNITYIEEMYTYLDEKYPEIKFNFHGYINGSNLDKQTLVVSPEDADEGQFVEVVKEDDHYVDNYQEYLLTDDAEAAIITYFNTKYPELEIKVYCEIDDFNGKFEDINKDNVLTYASVLTDIYILESDEAMNNFTQINKDFITWYEDREWLGNIGSTASMCVYDSDIFNSIIRDKSPNLDDVYTYSSLSMYFDERTDLDIDGEDVLLND